MDLEKRIQLEKIYRKRRIYIKAIIVVLFLMVVSFYFKNYIPKEIYSTLKFVYVLMFFLLLYPMAFLIRKIPPLLCDSPSFTKEQHYDTLNKSIIHGTVFTFSLTAFFLLLSKFLTYLTIEFVCTTIVFSFVLSPLVVFLVLDKKNRIKAKSEIENNSKK